MKMKKLLSMMLVATLVVSMAACGKKEEKKAEVESKVVSVQSEVKEEKKEEPEKAEVKNEVVISLGYEPQSLDPCMGWGHGTAPLVQSTLVEYKQDMSFVNDLATEYTLSEDGLTWTFRIRKDVKFTDGEPLKASDVVFTFNTAKASRSELDLTFMDKVEAKDEETVVFSLKKPTNTFLNTIATIGIVPEHAYGPGYGDAPIGSGPFKFVQWNKQEQIILEANEAYYGTVPAMKKVTLVFQEADAAFAAVQAGQVDIAVTNATLATAEVDGYELKQITTVDNRGFTMPMEPDTGKKTESGFPYGNNVTSDLAIRQALAYGIDREMIAKDVLNGFATPCYSENDGMPWNNEECKIETDKEYAKKLLADGGWADSDGDGIVEKNGIKAEFTVVYSGSDPERQAISLSAAAQAKEFGIFIHVEGMSWDEIAKRMFSDAVCMGWGSSNPYTSFCLFHSGGKLKDDFYNPEGYDNKTVNKHLEAAMQALTVEEANENWKLAQWDGQTGTAMKGDSPWVWLVNLTHVYYARKGLDIGKQQLHAHGESYPLIQNLRDWKWME